MSLQQIKSGENCPICNSADGRCRSGDAGLIICRSVADSSGETAELKFIGQDKAGNGKFAPPREPVADPVYPIESLTAEERNRRYREMLGQLALHPDDRADLLRRGLTSEQIEAGLFRSVVKWQAVNGLPLALPGVLPGGRLNAGDEGYLCPVWDTEGRIAGLQLRLRHPSDGNRYRWLTSKTKKHPDAPTPHLDGQLPLTIARPLAGVNQPNIGVAEGILKPWIAARKHGQIMIGAAGGLFKPSSRHFKAALEAAAAELGSWVIDFYPDGGAIKNEAVRRQYFAAWNLLLDWGFEVRICWWGQFDKSDPDIDELPDLDSVEYLTVSEWTALGNSEPAAKPEPTDFELSEERRFSQIAIDKLYSDAAYPWICVAGSLHQWTETYYQKSSDDIELRRIQELANQYSVVRGAKRVYPYASAASVRSALEWVKISKAVEPEQCNPEGLNCTNGVLVFDESNQPYLKPHSPDSYFLYQPTVAYTPGADSEACDRLLAALRPDQLQVFLKTIAATFNIQKARRKVGRIRALLAIGTGSNGKDALREAVSLLFGRTAITSVSLEDFASYDAGRKFDCSPLINSVINWASENRPGINLDKLKSLMRAVTGEALHFELKNKDSREFQPNAIQIFNLNEVPNIKAAMEATKTRFAVCNFDKTFKVGADSSKGELEADTRLKYDSEYVTGNVLPALLNYLVQAYQDLMANGIDYACCDRALEEIQIQNSHLFEFALETGLTFDPDSTLPIGDLWAALENYYVSSGVLTINLDGSKVWEDPIRPGDLYVKGANQIPNRFLALYPQAKKVSLGGNRFGLKGLRFGSRPTTPDDNKPDLAAQISKLVAERLEGVDFATVDPALIADQIAAQFTQKQPAAEPATEPASEPTPEPRPAPAVAVDSDWQPRPGERVWAWDSNQGQWQQAEILSVPNRVAKDSRQSTAFWKVRLETGAEPYIWDRAYLSPLVAAA